jgi:hypothetical protein
MLLALFSQIIDSYHTKQGQGIPIGNLTSQYFANHYLAIMDHFIQTDLHIKPYIRYMDDFVIWHHNKEDLKQLGQQITEFLIEKLGLSLKTYVLNSSPKGIGFLGFRVYPHRIYLARRSKVRFKAKMKRYTTMLGKQIISQEAYSIRVQSLHSFVSHAESLYFRQRVLSQIGQ